MSLLFEMKKDKHFILSSIDYTTCSTDNNCVSILIDYGANVPPLAEGEDESSRVIIDRAKMVLSERYTSQKQFTALKSKDTFYSVLKFKTGAVIIVGLQQTDLTDLCVIKATSAICDTMKYPITIKEVSVVNMVSTFNRFSLNFQGICSFLFRHRLSYNHIPENFPGMFFKMRVPKMKSKRMDRFKYLGAYYTQVALEMMATKNKSERESIIKKKFRVKTVLIFKVGKCTVLGDCGAEDVSIISRLLFGFFHYFMDHNIKMSEKEIIAIRKKYNIPPLEWYVFVDVFLHTDYYNKPSIETLRKAMAGDPNREPLDAVYFGTRLESASSTMSCNRIPSLAQTIDTVRTLKRQKITANYLHEKEELSAKMAESLMKCRRKPWWETKGKNSRVKNTRRFRPLLSSMDGSSVGRNSEWFMTKHEKTYNKIMKLIDEELNESLISAGYRSPSSSASAVSSKISSIFLHGSRVSQTIKIRNEYRVKLARLNTGFEIFKFLNKELISGSAPELARLLGTDVYSLLGLIQSLPLSGGHYTALRERFGDEYNLTPGVRFFNRTLNCDKKRCLEDDEEAGNSHDTAGGDENKRTKRAKRYTPSDFIDAITSFDDDGISKVGIKFNVKDIINTLNNEVFVPSDSPNANYRTSLHANYQVKTNLCRLLAMMLNDGDDITEEEVKMIRKALENNTSSHLLASYTHGNKELYNNEEEEDEDEAFAAMTASNDICEDYLEKNGSLLPVCKCCNAKNENK